MALDFDGSNDTVSYGDRTEFDGAAAVTWSWWQCTDIDPSNRTSLIRQAAAGTGWNMGATSLGRLTVILGITIASAVANSPVDSLVVGQWQHIFVVYDGGQATNALRLRAWIDATEQTMAYTNDSPATLVSAAGANLLAGNTTLPIDGKLGHLKIWLAALPTLVRHEMLSYRPTRTANLLIWSPYDDDRAARNYAGNGFQGTLSGALAASGPAVAFGGA